MVKRIFAICISASVFFLFVKTLFQTDQSNGTEENRVMAEFPSFPLITENSVAFFKQLDLYISDHLAFRTQLLALSEAVKVNVLRSSTSGLVLLGNDGWLIYRGDSSIEDFRNAELFSPSELSRWVKYIKRQQQNADERGIQYVFMIAPSAHTIYGDITMPKWVTKTNTVSRFDQLAEALKKVGIAVLDSRKTLLSNRIPIMLYHRTDTHWNGYGAFFAYQELMRRINIKTLRSENFNSIEVTGTRFDLTRMLGPLHIEERYQKLVPKEGFKAISRELDRKSKEIVSNCTSCGNLRALIYRDSFFVALAPYFSEHFATARYIWKGDVDWQTVDREMPDILIQEFVERILRTWVPEELDSKPL